MSSHTLSTFNSKTLNAPKLRDDGSNWADYHAQVQVAMEVKGLWKHVEEKATPPKPYAKVNGIAVLSDGKTQTNWGSQMQGLHEGYKLSQARYSVNNVSTHWYEDKNSYHCKGDVGWGEERCYCKEHTLPCGCGMPTRKHEAFWVIWPKNSPSQTKIALPIDDVETQKPTEDGVIIFQAEAHHTHYLFATKFIQTHSPNPHSSW